MIAMSFLDIVRLVVDRLNIVWLSMTNVRVSWPKNIFGLLFGHYIDISYMCTSVLLFLFRILGPGFAWIQWSPYGRHCRTFFDGDLGQSEGVFDRYHAGTNSLKQDGCLHQIFDHHCLFLLSSGWYFCFTQSGFCGTIGFWLCKLCLTVHLDLRISNATIWSETVIVGFLPVMSLSILVETLVKDQSAVPMLLMRRKLRLQGDPWL